jgi:hypothetical protein
MVGLGQRVRLLFWRVCGLAAADIGWEAHAVKDSVEFAGVIAVGC